jgi:hypothetical protein
MYITVYVVPVMPVNVAISVTVRAREIGTVEIGEIFDQFQGFPY